MLGTPVLNRDTSFFDTNDVKLPNPFPCWTLFCVWYSTYSKLLTDAALCKANGKLQSGYAKTWVLVN